MISTAVCAANNALLLVHCMCAGLIGTAPSQELLDIWNKREAELVEAGPEGTTLGGVLHTRPLGEGDWLTTLAGSTGCEGTCCCR